LVWFSTAAIYTAQILIVPGIVAFARKIAAEYSQNTKPQSVVGINGSWDHQGNRSAHILDMVEVGSGQVVDFEIARKELASGHGNYQGSSNGMEVEAMRRMVKR
jgi:hypothetical protein